MVMVTHCLHFDDDEQGFTLALREDEERPTIEVAGNLDILTSSQLRDAIKEVLSHHPKEICLSVASVSFVDSTGLAVLAGGYKRARAQGCDFVIHAPSPAVRRILAVTQLGRFVSVEG